MTDLSEQDKALCEAAAQYVVDLFRREYPYMIDDDGEHLIVEFSESHLEDAFVAGVKAQLAEHPNATDWQNRSERAEAECAELREGMRENAFQSFADEQQWLDMHTKIDALQQHAEAMAEELEGAAWLTEHEFPELSAALRRATANWTAWLIDNPLAQGD